MGKSNSKRKNLNAEISKSLNIEKNKDAIALFKKQMAGKVGEMLTRSNDNSNLSNLPVNTKKIYKMCNRLMQDIYTDIDNTGLTYYNSFFLFNFVEDLVDNDEIREQFYRDKLNFVDKIIFTENLDNLQLNLSKFSDSNLSMSMSRSYSQDKLDTRGDYLIDDNSVNLNLNTSPGKGKSRSRSKTKVQYTKQPKVNIKVKLKDIIKEDVIENSILDKTYNLKGKKPGGNLNLTNISRVNDTSAIMNEEPSFVDIIDILAQTDLSYKVAIKQKKMEKANKMVTARARSPKYQSPPRSKSPGVSKQGFGNGSKVISTAKWK
jgi:hypothetical protein